MGGPTKFYRLCLCGRLHNCIAAFTSDLSIVDISRLKTVFCMLPVNKLVLLPSSLYLRSSGGSSSTSIYMPSSTPYSPSDMVSLLLSSSSNTPRLSFDSLPTFIPQRPGKALWVVRESHLTVVDTPMLSIFTSCSVYAFSISIGSKCTIMHSLLLQCFNVEMLHVRSYTFSPSKPCTLVSQ